MRYAVSRKLLVFALFGAIFLGALREVAGAAVENKLSRRLRQAVDGVFADRPWDVLDVAIEVDNVDGAYQQALAAGAKSVLEPRERSDK